MEPFVHNVLGHCKEVWKQGLAGGASLQITTRRKWTAHDDGRRRGRGGACAKFYDGRRNRLITYSRSRTTCRHAPSAGFLVERTMNFW